MPRYRFCTPFGSYAAIRRPELGVRQGGLSAAASERGCGPACRVEEGIAFQPPSRPVTGRQNGSAPADARTEPEAT